MNIFSNFTIIDLVVIVVFFLVIFFIAAYYSRQASKNMQQFFLSGRNLPWYLAGTAMVATTFAADTPLAVTELVATRGIAGNWLWWNMAIGGLLTVFFFAKLWRRSGVMTDLEFIEFRYSGKPAAILRGFRAIYLGLLLNSIIIAWVHKAMEKIFLVTVPGVNPIWIVVIIAIIIGIYASASGLLGTIRTDSFQFIFALTGCIILAVIVLKLPEVGGLNGITTKISPEVLQFFPRVGNSKLLSTNFTGGILSLTLGGFVAYALIQWWSCWYPGADPGGGGYVAQRMMSAKDEKHSMLATLWFNVAHYTLRPWPWILVALAALVILPKAGNKDELKQENPELYSRVEKVYNNKSLLYNESLNNDAEFNAFYEKYENTVDPGVMYPKLMVRYLPSGLLGLLIAVFLAAYMSTVASQLNWGTSYIINDFYKRFFVTKASEKHYVFASRIVIILLVILSLLISHYFLTTVSGAWEFIINSSAGIGAVLILRWFWWRINAWSEIAAMISPLIIYPIVRYGFNIEPPLALYPTTFGVTIVWIAVTFLTKPVKENTLANFYRNVHPGGIGWKKFRNQMPEVKYDTGYGKLFINWILGIVTIYSVMYFVGQILFSNYFSAMITLLIAILAAYVIFRNLKNH